MTPDAMLAKGNDYLYGRGVPKDYKQAVDWYRKAIAAGSTAAMTNLGFMYMGRKKYTVTTHPVAAELAFAEAPLTREITAGRPAKN